MLPEQAACDLCGLCMPACPTGALLLTEPAKIRVGLAILDAAACLRAEDQPCSACLDRCPLPGTAIEEVESLPQIIEAGCTGCGQCAELCPPRAISIVGTR